MCSSWILFVTDSALCLADSCASIMQLNLLLPSDPLVIVFETTVSRMHALGNALLHGIAFLFVSSFSGFSNSCPSVRPCMIWKWCRLDDFCQSPPAPHLSSRRSFVQKCKSRETSVHESDRFRFPSTFQWSSTRFSCATSKSVWVDLMTSIYFSGIGNDCTYNWTRGPIPASSFVGSGWISSLWPWDSPVRFSLYGVFPSQSGFLEFVVSSW